MLGLLSNLPANVGVTDVVNLCKHAVSTKDVSINNSNVRSVTRGVDSASALLEVRTREELEALRKALHCSSTLGRTLEFRPHVEGATIWVGDIPSTISSLVLRDAFEQLGEVEDAFVVTDPITLKSKEYGFVKFKSPQIAMKVIFACQENLFVLSGSPQPVSVEMAIEATDGFDAREATLEDVYTVPPHFTATNSLEFEFALEWRKLLLQHRAERRLLREEQSAQQRELLHKQRQIVEEEKKKWHSLETLLDKRPPKP